jgi:hypothetical protein
MSIENELNQIAAQSDPMFSFSGKYGGSIDVVGGSVQATTLAQYILSSLGQASYVAKESALGAVVAGAASLAALGSIEPMAGGIAGMAGVISSVSKGRG